MVWPGRTGPVVDVLYSAAGNSGDEFFYDDELSSEPDIHAWDFEVGVPQWDETTQRWATSAAGFFWSAFETATVYYTPDGSRPNRDSPTVEQDGVRGGAAPVRITEDHTLLQWFAVDEAGNVEGGVRP